MTSNPNPGNFANRPHDEVEDIAQKGGHASQGRGGFASMDEDKQVCFHIDVNIPIYLLWDITDAM